jgi:FdhD protein
LLRTRNHRYGRIREAELMMRRVPTIRIDGKERKESAREIAEEVPVAIVVNGRHAATAAVSPGRLEDLVVGYLFTEEIIRDADDIESIRVEENRISVLTKNLFKITGQKKTVLSGCGGAVSYIDTAKLPSIESGFSLPADTIRSAANTLLQEGDTIATVALAGAGGVIDSARDIDSHNALDRVIGAALRAHVAFSAMFVVTSGCITSEMVRKCLVAGVTILASERRPSALAVEIAGNTGLCLIGSLDTSGMEVYTHEERVSR